MGSFFVYALVLVSLIDTSPAPTVVHVTTWISSIVLEVVLLGASLAVYSEPHHEPAARRPEDGKLRENITGWEAAEIIVDILRIIWLLALVTLFTLLTINATISRRKRIRAEANGPNERTSLLNGDQAENGHANGHSNGQSNGHQPKSSITEEAAWSRPTTVTPKSWWEYLKGYSLFFPYLWPSKSRHLQLVVVFCFGLVMLQRVVNIAVPYQIGLITNILSGENGKGDQSPWGAICAFIVFKLLQGNQGFIGAARSNLWIPVGQYSYRELSTAAFEHVHGLSLEFHLGKKTGEVLSALSKGSSINTFLEQVTFQVVPMLIDLVAAIIYFLFAFDAYYALVVAIVTFCYLYITIRMAQWRADIRRQMVTADRQEDAVK